jgi:hypothetical protein
VFAVFEVPKCTRAATSFLKPLAASDFNFGYYQPWNRGLPWARSLSCLGYQPCPPRLLRRAP